MQLNKKHFSDLVFFLIATGELCSHIFDSHLLHLVFKPLLMIWLSVYFYLSAKNDYTLFAKFIQAGFFFSWLGDVFLMFDDGTPFFFILGLSAFLITHIFYILGYINSVKGKEPFLKKNWLWIIPFAIIGIGNFIMLFPKLGLLSVPVSIYTLAILTMVLTALNRKETVSKESFWMVFGGAVLFLISDSTISFNKFTMPVPYAEMIIMTTYISAQYLIMRGSLSAVNCKD